jgi:hypothetical protein
MSGISRDVKNHYTALQSIVPSTISSGTTNGTGVDLDNTDGGFATLEVGAVTALTTLDVALQESDTSGGTYTALPVVAAFPTVTTANKVAVINFRRSKRFVRGQAVVTGTSAVVACSIFGELKRML